MNELAWFLIADLLACLLIALLISALTDDRSRGPRRSRPGKRQRSAAL